MEESLPIQVNENGVAQFPKNDPRRLFVLMCAIQRLERPTIVTIPPYTGINKGSIDAYVKNLREFFGVSIVKADAVYSIESWGDILNQQGIERCVFPDDAVKKQIDRDNNNGM